VNLTYEKLSIHCQMLCKLDVRRKLIVTLALSLDNRKMVVRYFVNRSPACLARATTRRYCAVLCGSVSMTRRVCSFAAAGCQVGRYDTLRTLPADRRPPTATTLTTTHDRISPKSGDAPAMRHDSRCFAAIVIVTAELNN